MISGLQKMTLLDFPGKVACTVFIQGCNFRCPFCHNSDLLPHTGEALMTEEELISFLRSRMGLLDGVCLTGGEPTLDPALPDLIRAIRALGYAVKLDTNGSRPDVLKALVNEGFVDYVAMDVKNAPSGYGEIVGVEKLPLAPIEESLRFLISSDTAYELRTTLVVPFHTEARIREMREWLLSLVPGRRPKKYFLQTFVDRDSVVFSGLSAPTSEETRHYAEILSDCAEHISVRNP